MSRAKMSCIPQMTSKQIEAMRGLGFTDEEIQSVAEADARIDKGENLFPLSAEQEKASKAARITHSVDAYGKKRTREKKEDNDKAHLINLLAAAVSENPTITNPEREFEFQYNGRKFKVVLSCPRK